MTAALAPVILTATMGPADFAWANALRRRHFPPERNFINAHITLFHHLPPSILPELRHRMRGVCDGPSPPAMLTSVIALGRGVAFRVDSPALDAIRAELAAAFADLLTPQDRAPPRLHITVQNKVSVERARALHARLSADFQPRPLTIAGLAAWHYRGGPWEAAGAALFRR